jgi:DNA transformation protein
LESKHTARYREFESLLLRHTKTAWKGGFWLLVYDSDMPSKHAAFVQYVAEDVLSELEVKTKRMFGGHGFYHAGKMFGLEADGKIYFKVNDGTRSDYEAMESQPFQYSAKDRKAVTMSYWMVPEEVLEDREKSVVWARKAIGVAEQAKTKKPRRTAERGQG